MRLQRKERNEKTIVRNIEQTRYIKKKDITKEWLISKGFHYNRLFSDEDTDVYAYRFPVYKYERFTILECELRVALGEDDIYINVYDYNTINKYAPFYYMEYGNYSEMLKEIWNKINKELKKLGIKMEKEQIESKNKKIKRKCDNPNKRK